MAGHHDRVMQLNWLYFCGIFQMMPLKVWLNTALACDHQSICMHQLQTLALTSCSGTQCTTSKEWRLRYALCSDRSLVVYWPPSSNFTPCHNPGLPWSDLSNFRPISNLIPIVAILECLSYNSISLNFSPLSFTICQLKISIHCIVEANNLHNGRHWL